MLHEVLNSVYVADDSLRSRPQLAFRGAGSESPAEKKPRILVVDDERLIADTMTDILEGAGFEVATAYDGWSALEAASRFRPDYLLSDVSMPVMNGVELAIALRTMHPGIKVLLISGQAGISDLLRDGEKRGFHFDLFAKPIHPLKVIDLLKGR